MTAEKIHHFLIALGSNLGDRLAYLEGALSEIRRAGNSVVRHASIYETLPIGPSDHLFLNSAALVESSASPLEFLRILQSIETKLGRIRREKWGNRVIDLDIMLWRDPEDDITSPTRIVKYPVLEIPHPLMLGRDFMVVPAIEVAPDWVHPYSGLTLKEEGNLRRHSIKTRVMSPYEWYSGPN